MKQPKNKLTRLLIAFAMMGLPFLLNAQNITVKGKVVDALTGAPIESANITSKKLKNGASSKADGSFEITATKGDKLSVSFIGFESQQVTTSGDFLTIRLNADNAQMSEVVVTALGIKKDKKKLGYALQEVKGDQLTTARETNVVNQLAGKVAGVTVVSSNSGIGGSARVSIRGERSVDLNKNQPL